MNIVILVFDYRNFACSIIAKNNHRAKLLDYVCPLSYECNHSVFSFHLGIYVVEPVFENEPQYICRRVVTIAGFHLSLLQYSCCSFDTTAAVLKQ